MEKDLIKSIFYSSVLHLIILLIFSILVNLPSFEQKINFDPIEIQIQNSKNISQSTEVFNEGKKIENVQLKDNANEVIKTKTNENDKKQQVLESSKETIKTESKAEEVVEPIITEDDSKASGYNKSDEENSDEIVQQILSSQIETGNSQNNLKDNIQWNSSANRWVIKKIKPILPLKYQKKGISITCKIYIEINKFGSVISAIIVQSTGYIDLDQYIISVIKDWKFNQVTYDKIDSGYITFVFLIS